MDTGQTPFEQPGHDVDPVIVLEAATCRVSILAWCALVRSLLADGSRTVVWCDVRRMSGPAVEVLDALARLQLTARQCGGEIRLRHAEPSLVALLELVGFTETMPVSNGPATGPRGTGGLHRSGDVGRRDEPEQ